MTTWVVGVEVDGLGEAEQYEAPSAAVAVGMWAAAHSAKMTPGWSTRLVDVNRDGTYYQIHGWDGSTLFVEVAR